MDIYALAFGAHPDDVELCASATLLKLIQEGKQIAVCDLTRGELGSRGTPELRQKESEKASSIMGYKHRDTLNLGDGKLEYNHENIIKIVGIIRRYRPLVVLANPPKERHPDHEKASRLVTDAFFYARLSKIKTYYLGKSQTSFRPSYLLYYIHDRYTQPDIIVDVTKTFKDSRKAVYAFRSQFYDLESDEPETYISRPAFLDSIDARARVLGEAIGVDYGEGFLLKKTLGVYDFSKVFI